MKKIRSRNNQREYRQKQKNIILKSAIAAQQYGEFNGLCVDDLSEVPFNYRGLVLEVNDHGNITLYRKFKRSNFREIASQV